MAMTTPKEHNAAKEDAPLLVLRHVTKHFGGVTALNDVSFEVQRGEILGIIGPNGAGKSTLLSLISGIQRLSTGEILFDNHRLEKLSPHTVARLGIGRAHQIPRPFGHMTVHQNVLVPTHAHNRLGGEAERHASQILEVCGLQHRARQSASTLTLLDLKRLEVARALALQPRLLLLDEVAAGLVGLEIEEITQLIATVQASGVTILLVEHVQALIQRLAQRVIVLDWGRKIAEGTPEQIAEDPEVKAVYYGTAKPETAVRRQSTAEAHNRHEQTVPEVLLRLEQVSVDYGKFRALRKVDFEVRKGEIVAVLGANGAGKTTLTRAISGLVPTSEGKVHFKETEITKEAAHRRARRGIALCHEGRRLFKELTVRENIELGAMYAPRTTSPLTERIERIYNLFPVLRERTGSLAGRLSGGQQQMVAIARALVAGPSLLLLDELSLGLAPQIIDQLFEAFDHILGWGVSIVLIEQHIHRSLAVADRVYLLERGHISFSGTPTELQQDEALHQAYFGDAAHRLVSD
jgi:branched-chain amino acid transport system ATP-binding protein